MQTANGNTTAVERKALTEEQVNRFWIDGYLNIGKVLLDDEIDNGAMQFIPGSHFSSVEHEQAADTNALLDLGDQVDESKAVAVALPAGGVTLHHCQTLHYTAPNVTDRQRRAFVMHLMITGTKSLRDSAYLDVCFARPVLRMRV